MSEPPTERELKNASAVLEQVWESLTPMGIHSPAEIASCAALVTLRGTRQFYAEKIREQVILGNLTITDGVPVEAQMAQQQVLLDLSDRIERDEL